MEGYELVQLSPEIIYRKVYPLPQDNNSKNEYYYMKNGKLSDSHYNSINEAVVAYKEVK